MLRIRITSPNRSTHEIPVRGNRAVIGRDEGCDVAVGYEYVSKQHVQIDRAIVVTDLDSRNGTFVAEERIARGSPVVLGERELRLGKDVRVEVLEDGTEPLDETVETTRISELARIDELEADVADWRGRCEAAEHDRGKLEAELRKLRAELERRPAEDSPPSEPAGEDPATASGLDFTGFQALVRHATENLQRENRELRQQCERLERDLEAAARSEAEAEVEVPRPPAENAAPPVPATSPGAAGGARATERTARETIELVRAVAEGGGDRGDRILDGPLDVFLAMVGLRFLRNLERVITRHARHLANLMEQDRTEMPSDGEETKGNVHELLGRLLDDPDDVEARRDFSDHTAKLEKWFAVAMLASFEGALRFAEDLRQSLEPKRLVPDRVFTRTKGALWEAASKLIERLSQDTVQDKVEFFIQQAASERMYRDEPATTRH